MNTQNVVAEDWTRICRQVWNCKAHMWHSHEGSKSYLLSSSRQRYAFICFYFKTSESWEPMKGRKMQSEILYFQVLASFLIEKHSIFIKVLKAHALNICQYIRMHACFSWDIYEREKCPISNEIYVKPEKYIFRCLGKLPDGSGQEQS